MGALSPGILRLGFCGRRAIPLHVDELHVDEPRLRLALAHLQRLAQLARHLPRPLLAWRHLELLALVVPLAVRRQRLRAGARVAGAWAAQGRGAWARVGGAGAARGQSVGGGRRWRGGARARRRRRRREAGAHRLGLVLDEGVVQRLGGVSHMGKVAPSCGVRG